MLAKVFSVNMVGVRGGGLISIRESCRRTKVPGRGVHSEKVREIGRE